MMMIYIKIMNNNVKDSKRTVLGHLLLSVGYLSLLFHPFFYIAINIACIAISLSHELSLLEKLLRRLASKLLTSLRKEIGICVGLIILLLPTPSLGCTSIKLSTTLPAFRLSRGRISWGNDWIWLRKKCLRSSIFTLKLGCFLNNLLSWGGIWRGQAAVRPISWNHRQIAKEEASI